MTIAKRITVMYGGIFSFSILLISFIVFGNAAVFNQNITKQELTKTMNNIEQAIASGTEITQEGLEELLDNKYVEVSIMKRGSSEPIKSSVGNPPPFIERGGEGVLNSDPNLPETPPEETGANNKGQRRWNDAQAQQKENQEEFPLERLNKDYTLKSVGGHEFMLMERFFHYGEDTYFVQAFKMMTNQSSYLRIFGLRLVVMDILGIFLAFLIGRYISIVMLRPVEAIRQAAERISIEDLSQRIELNGPDDEMKELSITFNSMIERLELAFQKQNQFISDASHELRTPISVIQGYANLVNRWGKSDPQILQESIDSIMAETEHMSTLIKKLLFLAKSDQNRNHIQKAPMLLNTVAEDIVKELNVMEVNREICCEMDQEVMIYADWDLMKQLLWIYAENAVKYTKEGGKILFRVYQEGNYGCISVSDNGAGMSQEDIPLIFDRFYRADKSRNKEIPGTGLGLSIAQWIVESHHGKIKVDSELGKGSIFINQFQLYEKEQKKKK